MITKYRSVFDPIVHGIARGLIAARVTPTGVTWTALAVQAVGAYFVATHTLVLGAVVWGVGAALDAFDGTVARLTGRVTKVGGFLDSLLDRYGDGIILLAIGWHYDTAWVWAAAFAALMGSVATSYAKARVYQDVQPPTGAWPDLLERPERAIIVALATLAQGIVGPSPGPAGGFLPWIVVGLAVLTNLTVVQRARRAIGFLKDAEGST